MKVTRLSEAAHYVAPNHHDVRSMRLQGFDTDSPESFWTGLTHFLPGGGAGPDASALEKVYVVIAGSITVRTQGSEVVLGHLDSCCIPANEVREVINTSNEVASMLVVMPYAAKV